MISASASCASCILRFQPCASAFAVSAARTSSTNRIACRVVTRLPQPPHRAAQNLFGGGLGGSFHRGWLGSAGGRRKSRGFGRFRYDADRVRSRRWCRGLMSGCGAILANHNHAHHCERHHPAHRERDQTSFARDRRRPRLRQHRCHGHGRRSRSGWGRWYGRHGRRSNRGRRGHGVNDRRRLNGPGNRRSDLNRSHGFSNRRRHFVASML